MVKKKTKTIFDSFYELIETRQKDGDFNPTSKWIVRYNEKLKAILNKALKRESAYYRTTVLNFLRRTYNIYKDVEFRRNNRGLKGWRLEHIKPYLRQELRNYTLFSLSLINTQNKAAYNKISERFLNWCQSGKEKTTIQEALAVGYTSKKAQRHYQMILKDQSRKMISSFDRIVAREYGAIGFVWKTRRDKKVTGNPSNNSKPTKEHGDHYIRQDKFYAYPNNWASKNGLLKKSTPLAEFEDGMPGQPINCRCYAYNIYDIEDVPKEWINQVQMKKYLERGA